MKIIDPLKLSKHLQTQGEKSYLDFDGRKFNGYLSCSFYEEVMNHGLSDSYQTIDFTFPIQGKIIEDDKSYKFPYLDLNINYELKKNDDMYFRYTKIFGYGKIFLVDDKNFIGFIEDLNVENRFNGRIHHKFKNNPEGYFYIPLKDEIEQLEKVKRKYDPDYVYKPKKILKDKNMDVVIGKVELKENNTIQKISLQFIYDNIDRLEYIYKVINYFNYSSSNPNRNPL